jgi:hypothetical protein
VFSLNLENKFCFTLKKVILIMKRFLLFCLIASTSLLFTNCQKKQVLYSIKPPVSHYAQKTANSISQAQETKIVSSESMSEMEPSGVLSENVGNVSEKVITTVAETPALTPRMVASSKDVPSTNKYKKNQELLNHPKVKQFMGKVQVTKDAAGNYKMATREGTKLNIIEKMVVKQANKNSMKPNKGFKDWNKYLRYGIIILAAAFVISIMGYFIPFIWIIGSLAWLAGAILFWYGLGIELDWWKEL